MTRAHLQRHHAERLRRAYADAPRDPRAVASVDELFRTVSAPMIGDRDDMIARVDAAGKIIEHAFRVNGVALVTEPINPGALLDAATDPALSTADYIAMVEARYPGMKDAA